MRYGPVGAIIIAAISLGGCDGNRVSVAGTVFSVTHKCRYDMDTDEAKARAAQPGGAEMFGDCSTDGDFLKARQDFDSIDRRYSGTATARVNFISPVDNTSVEGELVFGGDEREFYTMRPNTQVILLVDPTDHSRIRFGGIS